MTTEEAKSQIERVEKFKLLDGARSALVSTRLKMERKSPIMSDSGALTRESISDPFTGNIRESRRIAWLNIGFSATQGGEKAVELELCFLNIPANEFGRMLAAMIEKRVTELNEAIEKL